jgi:formyltetrahydrofolate-dependent phosphoribosylglycinamide formyltransferase
MGASEPSAVPVPREVLKVLSGSFGMRTRPEEAHMSVSVAVFASGGGSNFQSLLDHQSEDRPGRIDLLISDRTDAGALVRAGKGGVPTRIIPVKGRSPEAVGLETLEVLEQEGIQVILLAGYLRLVPPLVVQAFAGRILNIHPALLPAFGGKGMWGHHVHEAVLASGATFSGPTVHFVDAEYDTGSILAQWPVPVLARDTPDTLAARVLKAEHVLYPRAADHLCWAVETGSPLTSLSLSGEAFMVAEAFSPEGMAHQIDTAFWAARE